LDVLCRTKNDPRRKSSIPTQNITNLRINLSIHFPKRKNNKTTTHSHGNNAIRISFNANPITLYRNKSRRLSGFRSDILVGNRKCNIKKGNDKQRK